jgi:hypothetical protein
VALAEIDGIGDPNMYGDLPLIDKDPAKPAVTPGNNPDDAEEYDYWDHVDYIIGEANALGLYVSLLPSWGRWMVTDRNENIFTEANARTYGEFLGRRYPGNGIIWILGGDRNASGYEAIWRAMAEGIAAGVSGTVDFGAVLMTYHPRGGRSSSEWFHDEPWLDFNMWQTAHGPPETSRGWRKIEQDYNRQPVKPVVDGEPLYEDHPIGFKRAVDNGFSFDAHVRQRAYWHMFAGACGHTYGHNAVWQMYAPSREPSGGPLYYWYEAIHRPGAAQMQHIRALIESRPMLSRVPDQDLVVNALDGAARIQATRGDDYAFIYTGSGHPFTVNMGRISGSLVRACWFNPRNGSVKVIGEFANRGTHEFVPQYQGFGSDWVLVLDDTAKGYDLPGKIRSQQ